MRAGACAGGAGEGGDGAGAGAGGGEGELTAEAEGLGHRGQGQAQPAMPRVALWALYGPVANQGCRWRRTRPPLLFMADPPIRPRSSSPPGAAQPCVPGPPTQGKRVRQAAWACPVGTTPPAHRPHLRLAHAPSWAACCTRVKMGRFLREAAVWREGGAAAHGKVLFFLSFAPEVPRPRPRADAQKCCRGNECCVVIVIKKP